MAKNKRCYYFTYLKQNTENKQNILNTLNDKLQAAKNPTEEWKTVIEESISDLKDNSKIEELKAKLERAKQKQDNKWEKEIRKQLNELTNQSTD